MAPKVKIKFAYKDYKNLPDLETKVCAFRSGAHYGSISGHLPSKPWGTDIR